MSVSLKGVKKQLLSARPLCFNTVLDIDLAFFAFCESADTEKVFWVGYL